jgi:uncharacterized protein with NAD-binding domain and iron-sulfur cluster
MPTRVIVLGGGVAGMSAAHELIERGFEVVVLERGQLAGGKARSIPVTEEPAPAATSAPIREWRRSSTGCPVSTDFAFFPASTSM